MFDELDALLKSAKREAHLRREAKARTLPPKVEVKRQADLEWTRGKTVCLIHRASDGTETALGLFVEWTRNGSRWLRPSAETLSPDHTEIVTGSWWLNPRIREVPMADSESEVRAIRARFEALLSEAEAEYGITPPSFAERRVEEDDPFPEDDDDLELEIEEDEEEDWDDDWNEDDEDF